jgi:hypothetical protein
MNEKKSLARRAGGYMLRSLTPWRSLARSASSVRGSVERTAELVRQARENSHLAKERTTAAREEEQSFLSTVPKGTGPKELFEIYYATFGWSEDILQRNQGTYKWAKRAWLFGSMLCLTTAVLSATWGHWLFVMLFTPTSMLGLIIMLAKAAKAAQQQARIELREMLSFPEFMGRSDFFKRLVF